MESYSMLFLLSFIHIFDYSLKKNVYLQSYYKTIYIINQSKSRRSQDAVRIFFETQLRLIAALISLLSPFLACLQQ